MQVTEQVREYLKKPTFDNWQWDDPEMLVLMRQMFIDLNITAKFNIEVNALIILLGGSFHLQNLLSVLVWLQKRINFLWTHVGISWYNIYHVCTPTNLDNVLETQISIRNILLHVRRNEIFCDPQTAITFH